MRAKGIGLAVLAVLCCAGALRAQVEPDDADGHLKLAIAYWEKAYYGAALLPQQKDDFATRGLASIEQALKVRPDLLEALVFKGLLLRVRASVTQDPKLQAQYLEQAHALRARTEALQEKKTLDTRFGGDRALKAFVEGLEASVKAGDAAAFDRVIDVDALLDAAMKGIEGPAALAAQFRQIERANAGFGRLLLAEVQQGARFDFLRIRSGPGGRPQALFRMLAPQGGVNYYDFALGRHSSGAVRMVDYYLYAAGEWKSESFRRNWTSALALAGLGAQLKRLAGVESDLVKYGPQLETVGKLAMAGENAAALKAVLALPASLQATKNLLMVRAVAAQKVGEREYDEAIEAFARHLPNDPALHFLELDFFAARKQYDRALGSLGQLDRAIGGDAYLDVTRGNLLYMKGDVAGAKAAMQQAMRREPSLAAAYEGLLQLSLNERDFSETAELLTRYERNAQVAINDLTQIPAYAEFVRSEAYRSWKRERDSRVSGSVVGGVTGGLVGGPVPPPPAPQQPVRVGGAIQAPQRIVDAPPVYPAIAQAARVQGVVILELTIGPDGTVSDAKVLRSIPLLDQAAIDTVKQWRYAPTLLNGVPVPVLMTVTVNFRLS